MLLAVVGLLLACAVVLFWPRQSEYPRVRLKMVRRGIEQGKPVVFFRIDGTGDRRIQIALIAKISGNWDTLESTVTCVPPTQATNFWAPSQVSPIMNVGIGRKEFGIIAPTNTSANPLVWYLRAIVDVETARFDRLRQMRRAWSYLKTTGKSFPKAVWAAWNWFYIENYEDLYSDPITNSIELEISSKAMQ